MITRRAGRWKRQDQDHRSPSSIRRAKSEDSFSPLMQSLVWLIALGHNQNLADEVVPYFVLRSRIRPFVERVLFDSGSSPSLNSNSNSSRSSAFLDSDSEAFWNLRANTTWLLVAASLSTASSVVLSLEHVELGTAAKSGSSCLSVSGWMGHYSPLFILHILTVFQLGDVLLFCCRCVWSSTSLPIPSPWHLTHSTNTAFKNWRSGVWLVLHLTIRN